MKIEFEYLPPEFKVIQYKGEDVITASGDGAVTPPWGGEPVINPEFPEIPL